MNPEVVAVLIPIVAIVSGVAAGMFATWTSYRRKAQFMENVHRERLAALERGVAPPPIPKELVLDGDAPSAAKSLRSGLVFLGIGIILYFALGRVASEDVELFGLIPAVVGIGNLLYAWLLMRRERDDRDAREPPAA